MHLLQKRHYFHSDHLHRHAHVLAGHIGLAMTMGESGHLLCDKCTAIAMSVQPGLARTIRLSRKHNSLELCENLSYS